MNKKISLSKKILFSILGLYLVNSFTPSLLSYKFGFEKVKNKRVQIVMKTKEHLTSYKGAEEELALKYLKLAHLISINYLDSDKTNNTSPEQALVSGKGDCTEASLFTYSNYLYIIKKNNNEFLQAYVRGADGRDLISGKGHSWLEIKVNNRWIPYETTSLLDFKHHNKLFAGDIEKLISNDDVLNVPNINYHRTNIFSVDVNGKRKASICFFGALTDYKGFIGDVF